MSNLRKYWPDLGMLVGIVTLIGVWINRHQLSEITLLLWLSFIAILIHQFEEYRWPGTFPGLFNRVIFNSSEPDRYPLNAQSAMIINLVIAYVFYLLPVFFPAVIWLALGPILMGFFQFIWHGIFANLRAKTLYNPGLFAVIALHLPIGGWYMHDIVTQHLATSWDWMIGIIYFVIAVYILIIKGNTWLKNSCSPYPFTNKQMGSWFLSHED